ncbi:MAG: hypothetical protein ACKVU4_09505 [Phycisphaerales bacterium]
MNGRVRGRMGGPQRYIRAIAAAVPSFFAAAAVSAQVLDQPIGVDPRVPLEEARAEYRAGVTADAVEVTLRPPSGPPRTERIVVRIDAAGIGDGDTVRRVLLELGPLTVFAGGGRIVAVHAGEPGLYWRAEYDGPLAPGVFGDMLPPLPVPQLTLAAPDEGAFRVPVPHAPAVEWLSATLDPAGRTPVFVVSGRGEAGPVSATFDAESHRLSRFRAEFPGPSGSGVTVLELRCRAIEPGNPERWEPDGAGRQRVAMLADLRGDRTVPPVTPGGTVPDISLLSAAMEAWLLSDALRAATAASPAVPPPAVLLLFRAPADRERAAAIEADARIGRDAILALRNPADGAPASRFMTRCGVVVELRDYSAEWFDAIRGRWGGRANDGGLLWASSSASTIDRFSRDVDALIAVIFHDRLLSRVIPLDGRQADAAAIADEVRGALTPRR